MDRRFRAGLLVGAPERLAVEGDDVRLDADEGGGPGDEAALELLRVEDGKDVAELVVRGGSDQKRPEAAQQFELLLSVFGDLNPALASRQHAEERQ